MIELLFGLGIAIAVPLAVGIALDALGWRRQRSRPSPAVGALLLAAPAIVALTLPRGLVAAALAVPWLVLCAAIAVGGLRWLVGHVLADRSIEPWRIGVAAAAGFLAVGAVWLVIDRDGLQPFGFARTIVLLTAVHFHVAGFVLTLAGSLAARERPGARSALALTALVVGTPLTALGFFGLPLVSWVGALLVAGGGIGIGALTIGLGRVVADPLTRATLVLGGATLFVTMPLAAGYATGATFGIAFLDIPAMAALHGGLNVIGFAIPTMAGWHRLAR